MHWSCLWLLDDGLVINPFSTCTQPSILVIIIKTKSTRKSVVSGGGKQEQVRLEKRPKAILKHYVSGWREMLDSDDGRIKIPSNVGIYNLYSLNISSVLFTKISTIFSISSLVTLYAGARMIWSPLVPCKLAPPTIPITMRPFSSARACTSIAND